MSRREKILAVVVVGLLVVVVGGKLMGRLVIGPARQLDARIRAAEARRRQMESTLQQKSAYIAQWVELGSRTLGPDDARARTRLDWQVKALLEQHGLRRASVHPLGTRTNSKTELKEVPFAVTAEGSLRQIVGFLYSFYRLPYLLRLRELTLSPTGRTGSGTIKMSIKIETLVLPVTKYVQAVVSAEGSANPLEGHGRLGKNATLGSYAGIYQKEIFAAWKPPKPKPPPPPKPRRPRGPKRPPKPPRLDPQRDSTRVVALLSYWDESAAKLIEEVVTYNDRTKQQQRIRLGQTLDGSKLVLVHWLGAVVQEPGSGKQYVYPLGLKLSQREELSRARYPELCQALQEAGR